MKIPVSETIIENGIELIKITEFYPNGQVRRERYCNNRFFLHRESDEPAYVEYDADGQVKSELYYKNGKLHREVEYPKYEKRH